jgi:hypothetical protein
MLSRCANPGCGKPFRYLHEGRIFNLPVPADTSTQTARQRPLTIVHFWLCARCCTTLKVVLERGEPVIMPLHPELPAGRSIVEC